VFPVFSLQVTWILLPCKYRGTVSGHSLYQPGTRYWQHLFNGTIG